MRGTRLTMGLAAMLGLSACAVPQPTAPGVMALPAPGKNFALFQQEDASCRQYAYDQSGGGYGAQNATNNAVGTAVAGTLIGAGVGAALGSLGGQVGTGAALGGTVGALAGGSAGANGAAYSAAGLQQRYDTSYTQCMYARGNTIQNPPGGYAAGPAAYPYYGSPYYGGYYGGPAIIGGPTVVVGTGWGRGYGYGWGGRYGRRW